MSIRESFQLRSSTVTMSSRYSSILGPIVSKQTLKSGLELQTLPEVLEDETSEKLSLESEKLESQKSSEEICNENECFTFKSIPNPGLNRSYRAGPVKAAEPETEEDKYLRMVGDVQIAPVWRIVDSLTTSTIDLQYYGLDSRQIKPLCEALLNNTSVTELNLRGNALSEDALYHLGELLRKNYTLLTLDLQHCKISANGAEQLGNGLQVCPSLRELNLSYNQFRDEGMELLGLKLGYNFSLKKLNLSHNNLTHVSGLFLAEMMEENTNIEELDLSWNQICEEQGLKKFLNMAAEQNESLLKLDLSWNNLGGEKIANVIKNFISQHRTLEDLNLSHNKFESGSELVKIAKGLNVSEALRVLDLRDNGITADAAFDMVSGINPGQASLHTLHLTNTWVKPEFNKLREALQTQCGLKVLVEGVTGGTSIKGPDMQTLLLQRAHFLGYKPKNKKKKKDFGWFLLRLQKSENLVPVKKVKFEKLVIEDNIKFDEGLVDELAKRFRNENKKVDLNLMLEKYLVLYPETALPKVKEKKKAKGLEKPPTEGQRDSKSRSVSKSPKGSVRLSQTAKGSKQTSLKDTEVNIDEEKDETRASKLMTKDLRSNQANMEENNENIISEEIRTSKVSSLQEERNESYRLEEVQVELKKSLESNKDVEVPQKQESFSADEPDKGGLQNKETPDESAENKNPTKDQDFEEIKSQDELLLHGVDQSPVEVNEPTEQ